MGLSAAVVLAVFGCAAVSALSESHAQTFFTLKHNEPLQHTVDVRIVSVCVCGCVCVCVCVCVC